MTRSCLFTFGLLVTACDVRVFRPSCTSADADEVCREGEACVDGLCEVVASDCASSTEGACFARRYDAGLVSGTSTFDDKVFSPFLPLKTGGVAADSDGSAQATTGIANTLYDDLYMSETWMGEFGAPDGWATFTIPDVPNGSYNVHLHFSDWVDWDSPPIENPGDRLFNVDIQGERRLVNYDIIAEAGGKDIAIRESLDVEVDDGTLTITFTNVVFYAAVDAVEILPLDVAPLPLERP